MVGCVPRYNFKENEQIEVCVLQSSKRSFYFEILPPTNASGVEALQPQRQKERGMEEEGENGSNYFFHESY